MSTVTSTITAPVLVLNNTQKIQCNSALESIKEVSDKYRDWNDCLSQQLTYWCDDVCHLKLLSSGLNSKAIKKLIELKKVLANPFNTNYSIKKPMLDRQWTWEKSWLESYQTVSNNSPFDCEPMTIKHHQYAQDIIDIVNSIFSEFLGPEAPIDSAILNESDLKEKRYIFGQLSQAAFLRIINSRTLFQAEKMIISSKNKEEQTKKNNEILVEECNKKIKAQADAHNMTVAEFKKMISDLNKTVNKLETQIDELKTQNDQNAARIRQLEYQLAEARRRLEEIANSGGGGLCSIM
ncbi:MAG: hypothetical protein JHC93_05870 [Parachlamydiales bacterium]|nr:hypothetical protein [Parachlamydiales bacterium]